MANNANALSELRFLKAVNRKFNRLFKRDEKRFNYEIKAISEMYCMLYNSMVVFRNGEDFEQNQIRRVRIVMIYSCLVIGIIMLIRTLLIFFEVPYLGNIFAVIGPGAIILNGILGYLAFVCCYLRVLISEHERSGRLDWVWSFMVFTRELKSLDTIKLSPKSYNAFRSKAILIVHGLKVCFIFPVVLFTLMNIAFCFFSALSHKSIITTIIDSVWVVFLTLWFAVNWGLLMNIVVAVFLHISYITTRYEQIKDDLQTMLDSRSVTENEIYSKVYLHNEITKQFKKVNCTLRLGCWVISSMIYLVDVVCFAAFFADGLGSVFSMYFLVILAVEFIVLLTFFVFVLSSTHLKAHGCYKVFNAVIVHNRKRSLKNSFNNLNLVERLGGPPIAVDALGMYSFTMYKFYLMVAGGISNFLLVAGLFNDFYFKENDSTAT